MSRHIGALIQNCRSLVGRFQDLATEVRLDECARRGVAVNRRPTGGGAILMGRDQLGVALTLAADRPSLPGLPAHLYTHLSVGVMEGLRSFGLEPRFRPKNDLEVDGRKIAGLGICRDATGGMLFHTSLLVDLDVPLMLRLLSIPAEKISDKVLRYVADRTTTVRRAAAEGQGLARHHQIAHAAQGHGGRVVCHGRIMHSRRRLRPATAPR